MRSVMRKFVRLSAWVCAVASVGLAAPACTAILGAAPAGTLLDEGGASDAGGGTDGTMMQQQDGGEAGGMDAKGDVIATVDAPAGEAAPPACGPSSCEGCCSSTGVCLASPEEAGVCGGSGNTCSVCSAGVSSCTSGICLGCSAPTVILGSTDFDTTISGFPSSVATNGTTILAGSPQSAAGNGAAYFFAQSGATWGWKSTLAAPANVTAFGNFVAMSGSTAMASGILDNTTPTVFVYTQTGSSIFPNGSFDPTFDSDGVTLFAPSLAIDGDTAVVGASSLVDNAKVYTLSGSTWVLQTTLKPTIEMIPGLYAGGQVALSGDTAVVSGTASAVGGGQARWADVFVRTGTTWAQQASLQPAAIAVDNNPHATFSVGISGDTVVIGSNAGAFIYTRSGSTWTEQPTLPDAGVNLAPDDNGFGNAVAVSNDSVVIGSTIGFNGGSATLYGFSNAGWLPYPFTYFDAGLGGPLDPGVSVARSGSTVVVAAPGDTQFVPQGALLIYDCQP